MKKLTEEELASAASVFFESKGWKLYPEVVLKSFGGRVDIVGVKQKLTAAIECKTTFSYPVLEQITRWRHEYQAALESEYADESIKGLPHLLYVVVGHVGSLSLLKQEILQRHRIGLIEISVERGGGLYRSNVKNEGVFDDMGYAVIGQDRWRVQEHIHPKIQVGSRRAAHNISSYLCEDMLEGSAGAPGSKGAYVTPFRRTINKAKRVLEGGGEFHIAKIIEIINKDMEGHHYINDASAKGGISKFLVEFGIAERVDDYRPVFTLKKEAR